MTEEQYIRDLEEARDDFQRALADAELELRALEETNRAREDELDDLRDTCKTLRKDNAALGAALDLRDEDLADTRRDLQRADREYQELVAETGDMRQKLRQYLRGTCPLAQREELWEELLAWADA